MAQKGDSSKEKKVLITGLDKSFEHYKSIAADIWSWAELGYQETLSSQRLQQTLQDAGFTVEAGVAGIPTAFVASYGSGQPVIGILAEFDALPGLSQEATPEKSPDPSRANGHACGHHLFGVASVAAGIQLKEMLQNEKRNGTIRVYGTPAEEGGSGKVYMVREGLFNDVDVVLHWHPSSSNSANPSSSLANISAKFRFHGISAHAAGFPQRGRSALDGVEAMNVMVNMMREHVTPETRIHYVITDGGKAPNVVPDYAEVYYYARHPDPAETKLIFNRMIKAAEGAALGTETKMEYEIIGGVYNLLPVVSLAQLMYNNLSNIGGVTYTPEEIAFGEKIQTTFGLDKAPAIQSAAEVGPFVNESYRKGGGSTDVGDVSWTVPTVGLRVATWIPGTASHSWQAVACGGTDIGYKGMMVAAKTLTATGYDLFHDQALIDKAKTEWQAAKGADFKYEALIGDRPPALDYRE
ncbi:MAG: glutamate carboxypeptidase [Saprospiraceae bacterium]|nr:MAG: glutamate carboxypeptidase [Saprospiraceae bacterium]